MQWVEAAIVSQNRDQARSKEAYMNESGRNEHPCTKMLAEEEDFRRYMQRLDLLGCNRKSTAKEAGGKNNDYNDQQPFWNGQEVHLQIAATFKGTSFWGPSVSPPLCGSAMPSAADIFLMLKEIASNAQGKKKTVARDGVKREEGKEKIPLPESNERKVNNGLTQRLWASEYIHCFKTGKRSRLLCRLA